MSDDKKINVQVGLVNSAEFTRQAEQMGKSVHQAIGEVVKGEDGLSNFERAATRAMKAAFNETQKLHGALGKTADEVKRLEKMMLDFGRHNQTLRALASGGPTAAINSAARRGMTAQARLDPIYQLDETEKVLLDIQKRRVAHFQRLLKQEEAARARGDMSGVRFQGVRDAGGNLIVNPASDGVKRRNAAAYNEIFGLGINTKVGKNGKTSPEYQNLIDYVEQERLAYTRTALAAERKFNDQRRKDNAEAATARLTDLRREREARIKEERRFFADSRKQFTGVDDAERNRRANLLIDQAVRRQATDGASTGTQRRVREALEADLNTVNARTASKQQFARDTQSRQTPGERGVAATLDRVTTGGGAGLFAVQGQIMGNYLAMGAILSTFSFLAKFTTELEQALAQVQAISASTDTEMKSLSGTIMTVAGNSRIAAKEVADAAALMAQAGLSARDISSALGPITQLAVGTGTSLAETVDIVTSVMSVFQLQTGEAANVADTLTATMNKSKLGIQQFALGVQYAGNTAAEMGISYNELGAALAGMADNGVRAGSTLGTGMRQLLVDLQSPTKAASKVFDELGLTMDKLDVNSQGLFGVLRNLRDAGFDSADAYEALEVRAAAAYIALTNDLPSVEKLNLEILNTSAASKAAADQMDTLASRGIQFQNVFGTLVYELSGPLRDFLKVALVGLTEFGKVLIWLAPVMKLAFGAAIAAGITFMSVKLYELIKGLRNLPALYQTWKADLAATTALATGNAAAVTAVGTATANTNRIMGMVKWASIIGAAVSMIPLAVEGFMALGKAMGFIKPSADEVQGALNETRNQLASTQQRMDSVSDAIDKLNERSTDLEISQEDINALTAEMTARFSEFGLTIDGNVTKIEQLTGALTELNQKMLELKERQLLQQKQEIFDVVDTAGRTIAGQQINRSGQGNNAARRFYAERGLTGLSPTQNAQLLAATKIATGVLPEGMQGGLYGSRENQLAFSDELLRNDTNLARIANQLTDDIGASAKDPSRQSQLRESLAQIKKLQSDLLPMIEQASLIVTESGKLGITEADLKMNKILTSREYQVTLANARALNADMGRFVNGVVSKGDPLVDEVEALQGGVNTFRGRVNYANNSGDHIVRMIAKAMSISEEEARAKYNATPAAREALAATKLLESNFQSPDYVKKMLAGNTNDADAAKQTIDSLLRISKGKRRDSFSSVQPQLEEAITAYIDSEMQKFDWSLDRADRDANGQLSTQAQARRAARNTELLTEADGFREAFADAYDRRPDGSKSFGGVIETNTRKAARIDAEMKKLMGTVDGQSSPEEIQAVIDLLMVMNSEWEKYTSLAQKAKYDKAKWEDPSVDTAGMLEDHADEIAAHTEQTIEKEQELLRDTRAKLAQKGFEAQKDLLASKLSGYLGQLRIYDDAGFDAAIAEVDKQVAAMVTEAVKAFEIDPNNSERLAQLEPEKKKLIDSIMATVPALYQSVVDGYNKGLVAQAQRTATTARQGADRTEKRISMFGLPTTGLYMNRRASDQAQLSAMGTEVDVAQSVANDFTAQRIAAQDKLRNATADTMAAAEAGLLRQVDLEQQSLDILQQKKDAYEDAKISFMNMGDEIWNVNKLFNIFADGAIMSFADGLSTALESSIADLRDVGQAFENLADDILKTLQKMAAKILAEQILTTLLQMFTSFMMSSPWQQPGYVDPGSMGGAAYPTTGGDVYSTGGSFNTGGIVRAAIGRANPNRDSVLTLVQPGEGILRKSAMDMIGTEAFNEVNARGNRRLSQASAAGAAAFAKKEPDMVNIYLVPKDAVPPTSKKEIVLAVSDDIAKNGQIKQLIQQVAIGGR